MSEVSGKGKSDVKFSGITKESLESALEETKKFLEAHFEKEMKASMDTSSDIHKPLRQVTMLSDLIKTRKLLDLEDDLKLFGSDYSGSIAGASSGKSGLDDKEKAEASGGLPEKYRKWRKSTFDVPAEKDYTDEESVDDEPIYSARPTIRDFWNDVLDFLDRPEVVIAVGLALVASAMYLAFYR